MYWQLLYIYSILATLLYIQHFGNSAIYTVQYIGNSAIYTAYWQLCYIYIILATLLYIQHYGYSDSFHNYYCYHKNIITDKIVDCNLIVHECKFYCYLYKKYPKY